MTRMILTWSVLAGLAACAAPDHQLETRVSALEHAPAPAAAPATPVVPPPNPDTEALAAINARLDKLDQRLTTITEQLSELKSHVSSPPPPRRAEPDRALTYSVPIDNDPMIGSADAKITMVIACDYASPYCEKIRDTLADLRKKYGNDLRLVYKQFVVHPQVARASALAACAADRQHHFAEMDDALWDQGFKARQFDKDEAQGTRCWTTDAGCPIVIGFATSLKLDVSKFKADMKTCDASVDRDMQQLQTLAVGATPSFFINGRFMSGAMPVENFTAVIDEELAKATDRISKGTAKARYYQKWVVDAGVKSVTP